MSKYRNIFYEKYFRNQAGRSDKSDLLVKMRNDFIHLKKEIIPLIPENKELKILEIGCGYGNLLFLLQRIGYSQTEGIDVSEEQVEIAKKNGIKNIIQGDMKEFLRGKMDSYDVIIGLDIIEHFTKDELVEVIGIIKNALRNKGTIIFRTPNADAPFSSTFSMGDFTHELILNYSSAEQLFFTLGFHKTSIKPSFIQVEGWFTEIIRKIVWWNMVLICKLCLFASGKSTGRIIFTPNLLIKTVK